MNNIFLGAAVMFFLISCTSNKPQSAQTNADEGAEIMIPESGCFALLTDKDTILLKIEVFPNVVTGVLKYQLSEKDKNEGTIEGRLEGNTVFADYTFYSEGVTSVREVAFLLNGDHVMEGFGDMEEHDGKMVFKDKARIDFSTGIRLTQIDCVENDEKFRMN